MNGLEIEADAFLKAVCSGMTLYAGYMCIVYFRKIVKHSLPAVSIEDFLYWLVTGFYLFAQIFDTSAGAIRWYFVIGTAVGALIFSFLLSKVRGFCRKIFHKTRGKTGKGVD